MSKHTQGPWRIVSDAETLELVIQSLSVPGDVCSIDFFDRNPSSLATRRWLANAHLIACAPELLDALSELERAVSARFSHLVGSMVIPPDMRDVNDRVIAARAVLAKATGDQS